MASLTSARNRFHAKVQSRLSQVLSIPAESQERGFFSTQIVRRRRNGFCLGKPFINKLALAGFSYRASRFLLEPITPSLNLGRLHLLFVLKAQCLARIASDGSIENCSVVYFQPSEVDVSGQPCYLLHRICCEISCLSPCYTLAALLQFERSVLFHRCFYVSVPTQLNQQY